MFNHSFTSTLRSRAGSFLLASSIAVASIAVAGLTESPVNATPVSRGEIFAERRPDAQGAFNVYAGEEIGVNVSSCDLISSYCRGRVGTALDLVPGDVLALSDPGGIGYPVAWTANEDWNNSVRSSSYTVPNPVPNKLTVDSQGTYWFPITTNGTRTLAPRLTKNGVPINETPGNESNPIVIATALANIDKVNGGMTRDVSQYTARVGDASIQYTIEACVDMALVAPNDVITWSYAFSGGTTMFSPNMYWNTNVGTYGSDGHIIPDPEPTTLKGTFNLWFNVTPGVAYTFSLDIKKGNDSVAINCPVNNPNPGNGGGSVPPPMSMPRLYPTGQVSLAGQLTLGSTLTVSLPSWSLTDGGPAIANTDISAPDIKWILCSVGPDAQRTDITTPMPQCLTPPNTPSLLLANGTFGMPTGPGQTFSGSSLTITQPLLTALDGKYLMVDVFLQTTPAPGQMMGVFYAFNFKSCAPGENCADSFGNTSAPDTSAPDTSAPATTAAPTTAAPTTAAPTTTTSTTITPSSSTTTVPPPALATVRALPVAPTPIIADATISTSEEITVTFGGFTPFEFVQLIVASTPQVMGSGYADAQGVVTLRGSLPSNLASGNHTLAVFAPDSGIGFTQPIIVSRPLLPVTGSDSPNDLFAIAMILFVLGIVVRRTSTAITNK